MHSIRTQFLCCPTGPMWPQELLAERFNDFLGLNPLDYSVWGKSLRRRPTSSLTITKNSLKVSKCLWWTRWAKRSPDPGMQLFLMPYQSYHLVRWKAIKTTNVILPKTGLTEIVKSQFVEWFNLLKVKNYIIKAW